MPHAFAQAASSLPDSLCVIWLRNDLRLEDNPALLAASQAAANEGTTLVALFAVTPEQWQTHDESPAKLGFIRARLQVLQTELAEKNIPLLCLETPHFESLPRDLLTAFSGKTLHRFFYNAHYGLNEQRLERNLTEQLQRQGCTSHCYHGELLIPPGNVLNLQGSLYQVFTPFAKNWSRQLETQPPQPHAKPKAQPSLNQFSLHPIPQFGHAFREDLWSVSTQSIHQKLRRFVSDRLFNYADQRDFPAQLGTSTLSPYLAIGSLGIRTCLAAVLRQTPLDEGVRHSWVIELAWREFYRHWMAHLPRLSQGRCFKPAGERIQWCSTSETDARFQAWSTGTTGFPIVDAGMRQLRQTGWMHNRVRMITAAFLSKLLRVDWRLGERFFMQHLVDGDFASNNGGWQWAASVGADAAPYFRIFNPYRQSERFDPEGEYIRRFVPELADVTGKSIHCPTKAHCLAAGYPLPIIDYPIARKTALNTLEAAFKT